MLIGIFYRLQPITIMSDTHNSNNIFKLTNGNYTTNENDNNVNNIASSSKSLARSPNSKNWTKEQTQPNEDPRRAIKVAYECTRKIIELDTENVVSELNVIESVNNVAILKFRDLSSYCKDIETNSEDIKKGDKIFKENEELLKKSEDQIDKLYMLSLQIDEWSHELELKLLSTAAIHR